MIHFSHGNGFPAETYHQIIKGLRSELGVGLGYISCLGHNPKYQMEFCWSVIVNETIDYIESHYNKKIIAVGHSLGGVVSYLACMQRPDLFKAVVMLDAPVFGYYKLAFISLLKYLGLLEYFTPAKNTRNRKYSWSSYNEALEHFASKRVFKYFDKQCLKDYVYFGTEKIPETKQIKLLFDPLIEWKIYRSLPSISLEKLPSDIPCGLVYGEYSKVISEREANNMIKNYGFWAKKLTNCGHLLPFEQPKETVLAVTEFINDYGLMRD